MVFGYRLIFDEPFRLGGGDVGVFHSERASHAAAVAGVQLHKDEPVQLLVLQFFQDAEDIDDAVRCQVVVREQSRCLPACAAPSDADPAGVGQRGELALVMPHVGQEQRIDIFDRHHIVNAALLDP